jgi:Ras-related protein Rab-2A
MYSEFEYVFKYIIVGESCVGKSSIMTQFVDNKFNYSHEMTIGVDFSSRMININNKNYKLNVWDTAGQESFRSITRAYYRSSAAVILVYDITNYKTFIALDKWIREINYNITASNPPMILIGNKCDLDAKREVTYDQGKDFADRNKMLFIEVSARQRINIEEAFIELTKVLIKRIEDNLIDVTDMNNGIRMGISAKESLHTQTKSVKTSKCC